MESLAGKEKLPEFIAAYEKLIARIGGGGKRRIVIVTPTPLDRNPMRRECVEPWMPIQIEALTEYQRAALGIATRHHMEFVHTEHGLSGSSMFNAKAVEEPSSHCAYKAIHPTGCT